MTGQPPEGKPSGRIADIRAYRPSFVGMVLLACTPFLVLGARAVYGAGGIVALLVVWLALFVLGCRWFMSHPQRVVLVGALSLVAWLVVVLLTR